MPNRTYSTGLALPHCAFALQKLYLVSDQAAPPTMLEGVLEKCRWYYLFWLLFFQTFGFTNALGLMSGVACFCPQKLPLWGNITASSVFICNSFRLLILKTILKFTVIGNLIPLQALQAPWPWRLGVLQSKCLTNFLPQSLGKFENVCTKFERTFCPAFVSRELLLITSTLTAASVCGRKRPRIT